jgi:hypothetical protein
VNGFKTLIKDLLVRLLKNVEQIKIPKVKISIISYKNLAVLICSLALKHFKL